MGWGGYQGNVQIKVSRRSGLDGSAQSFATRLLRFHSFFELMNETEKFMLSKGVNRSAARPFISSFYSSLAKQTERSSDTYAEMAGEIHTYVHAYIYTYIA